MIAFLMLLQSTASDIVISGKRLEEAQATCVRGACTPLRDARASIALAEARFRDGAYLDAKRMLAAAVARNRGKAASDPKPVAALYEAYATVALHDGDRQAYRRAVAGRVRTLRDNLPADDPAVIAAAAALGDMWMSLGEYEQAADAFRAIERTALRSGLMQSAMLAAMKNVWLASALGEQSRAERMLAELEARPAADNPDYRVALRVLRLRIAARDADDAEMAQLVREIGHQPGMAPALIWSPAFKENSIADANAAARRRGEPDPIRIASSDIAAVQWIDVGFWIRPDGRTAAVEILRGSRTQGWAPSVVRQIEGRRYTADASATTGLGEGSYRVERVSKRAEYFTPIGSLIRRRVGASGFEILDLTDATG